MALARRIRFNPFYRRQAEGCWRLARPRRFAPSKGPTRRGNQVMSEPTTIIGGPVSPYVRKVMAVCDVKGVAYRIDPIIPFQGNDEFSRPQPTAADSRPDRRSGDSVQQHGDCRVSGRAPWEARALSGYSGCAGPSALALARLNRLAERSLTRRTERPALYAEFGIPLARPASPRARSSAKGRSACGGAAAGVPLHGARPLLRCPRCDKMFLASRF